MPFRPSIRVHRNLRGTSPGTESTESASPATVAAVCVTLPVSLSQKIIVGRWTQSLGIARCGATGYRKNRGEECDEEWEQVSNESDEFDLHLVANPYTH
jgi:hypothetical protein